MTPRPPADEPVDTDPVARRRWRCPPAALGPDGEPCEEWLATTAHQWELFAGRLARALQHLRPGDRLVLSDVATHDFIQFARERDLLVEAKSNQYILGWYEPLTVEDCRLLASAGWHPPTFDADAIPSSGVPIGAVRSPNWWRRAPTSALPELAFVCALTFAWGYRTGRPDTLCYRLFNMRGRRVAELDFMGIEHAE